MAYTIPEGKMIDWARVGTKGYPMHWEVLGIEPPLTDAPSPPETPTEPDEPASE